MLVKKLFLRKMLLLKNNYIFYLDNSGGISINLFYKKKWFRAFADCFRKTSLALKALLYSFCRSHNTETSEVAPKVRIIAANMESNLKLLVICEIPASTTYIVITSILTSSCRRAA